MISEALKNPLSLFDVKGKSALVTGASGAFGRAVSIALAALGANLTLVAGNKEELEAVADECREVGGQVQTINRRPDSLDDANAMIDAAVSAYGDIELMFIGSGYNKAGFIHEQSYEDWQAVMDANVRGNWFMAKAYGTWRIENERKRKHEIAKRATNSKIAIAAKGKTRTTEAQNDLVVCISLVRLAYYF